MKITQMQSALANRPLALLPDAVRVLASLDTLGAIPDRDWDQGYENIQGVAVIQVTGLLLPNIGFRRSWGWLTGYDGIETNVREAIADPAVRAIVLRIDSPGGAVSGCFDAVDNIFGMRGAKPIWAIVDDTACSAAYAVASAADRIVAPRTGCVGSIGVIMLHVEISRMLDAEGYTPTLIQFGDKKSQRTPLRPLTQDARDHFQADVDALGELFVATVARNRAISAEVVIGTQAATYLPKDAMPLGLIDAVASPEAAFAALLSTL